MPNIKKNKIGDLAPCRECDKPFLIKKSHFKYGNYICGKCDYERTKKWVGENRDKKRLWNNLYSKRNPEKIKESTKRYRLNHPIKRKAHMLVQTAIRNGSLKRQGCSICGIKAHAHHEDYSKPLDILWLCHKHHMEHHHKMIQEDIDHAEKSK